MKEDIIRIEYKLDLIIRALQHQGLMLGSLPDLVGVGADTCPVCTKPVLIQPDFNAERFKYDCGCSLPQSIVTGISDLLTPTEEKTHGSSRTIQDSELLQPAEDRSSDS
jgi:hypothetical protein